MNAQDIQQDDAPHQFEPLLPSDAAMAPLLERASDLARASHALAVGTATGAQPALRRLLRSMNSYDANRLEGEHTRPSYIELALQQDFSTNADLARRQRLAVAHIHTEEACEAELARRLAADGLAADGETAARWLYSPDALMWLHQALFSALPAADLLLADGSAMEKWRRKSEQRDKWKLRASSRAEEGLARRSFDGQEVSAPHAAYPQSCVQGTGRPGRRA